MAPTIRVDGSTWKRVNKRKEPGDSFDDAIRDLLDEVESPDCAGGGTDDE